MFAKTELKTICHAFQIDCDTISDVIDTSRGEDDLRFNYKIDNNYFLKINTSKIITETFLQDIMNLIAHYEAIGLYCPKLIKAQSGNFTYSYTQNNVLYTCYIEECAPYEIYSDSHDGIDYLFRQEAVEHLGRLASSFSNIDLSPTKSMWSLIELGPFDVDRDEKQENLDALVQTLHHFGYTDLSEKLIGTNQMLRQHIKQHLSSLPRCVYQGDLNDSNLLVDAQGHFKGLIDFNMFGTEVNINCFLNETMYYLTKEDFDTLTTEELFNKMLTTQQMLLAEILKAYSLNALELTVWNAYKKVIYLSFYPNVMLWISLIEKGQHSDKVLTLIHLILDLPAYAKE